MSFLQDIQHFSKSQLKTTETHVTYPSGQQVIEGKDSDGYHKVYTLSSLGSGFVKDLHADLQVGEVIPGLIIGSQDVAADLDLLIQYEVTHVLNLSSYEKNCFPHRITYKHVIMYDLPTWNIIEHFHRCFQFIDRGRRGGGCVLVHCNAGVSRSATIVIAYLMKKENMSLCEAYDLVKLKRNCICPNPGFMQQLRTFSEQLGKRPDR